ncbi:hypothetical protein MSSIH_1119 [Methanosarcina siciliae HI350]|uniref:Uncharacterized protein n=1 Tax=Methanosarcina siciliae HI350 TaxID=1434119 RepID=A0A0E3PDM3_9EURY|nr:hypothetical protein MSSIH_1119 [Methanosarcina siciliae HI350]
MEKRLKKRSRTDSHFILAVISKINGYFSSRTEQEEARKTSAPYPPFYFFFRFSFFVPASFASYFLSLFPECRYEIKKTY